MSVEENFFDLRRIMVEKQLRGRDVSDERVLNAMLKVERHLFIPPELVNLAYDDSPVIIGYKQTISQPYMVAKMTEFLMLQKGLSVLEIGTGSGYQTAVLAEMGARVFSVERVEPLHRRAKKLFANMGYDNIVLKFADGMDGLREFAPYDRILVTAANDEVPPQLFAQLKEGGILVMPVGGKEVQSLVRVAKQEEGIKQETLFPCVFVPLLPGVATGNDENEY